MSTGTTSTEAELRAELERQERVLRVVTEIKDRVLARAWAAEASRDAAAARLRAVEALAQEWNVGERPGWWHGFVADLHRMLAHDCSTCDECVHDGKRCCGCYDGACCKSP